MSHADVNWKIKYQDLKMKFMSSVDTAFRLGFESGAQQAQVQSAQEQAQAAQQQQAQPGQEQPQEGQPEGQEQPQQPESANPQGSELDQHINELSSMLGKSELTGDDLVSLRKSFDSLKASVDLAKSSKMIAAIGKNLKLPKTGLTPTPSRANLTPTSKAALSMQEKIVADVMGAWETESKAAANDILSTFKRD